MTSQIFFVGTQDEVAHHAAPLGHSIEYQIAEPEQVTNLASRGDLAIFFSEHFDRFRNAIDQLREKGVGTLYMIDGILEWRNAWSNRADEPACPFTMRPVLCDKVACIGASQYRILQSWGNAGKVEIVGIPRLEKLSTLQQRKRATCDNFRLMVATAKCPSYTDSDQQNLRRCLTDIQNFTSRTQGIDVLWRLTADWAQKLGIENSLTSVDGGELAEQLLTVDAVITTPSTTALESMLLELPTAIVDYNNCPSYCQSAWTITAANQLESTINELQAAPEEKMLYQRQALADSLYLESSATQRMVELIKKMQAQLASAEPTFPDRMLATGDSIVAFESAALFGDYDEFKIGDIARLQTELAHSRREIKHLNSELAQLRNELGEAHQIFREINGHPIAGPIVKVRKKILDMVQKLRRNSPQPENQ